MSEPGSPDSTELWRGIGEAFGGAVVFGGGLSLLGLLFGFLPRPFDELAVLGMFVVFGISVLQLAWIIPMTRRHNRRDKPARAKGVWIGAAVIALLQGGCYGVVFLSLSSASFH